MDLKSVINTFPDFPKPGIQFRDISPILSEPNALNFTLDSLANAFDINAVDVLVGIESRGFPFACALASRFNKGMVMLRKAGKLPGATEQVAYDIEYGQAVLEVQTSAVKPGQKVLVIDDLLATGGTVGASIVLLNKLEANIVGFSFVVELVGLGGEKVLSGHDYNALVQYNDSL